MRRTSLAACVLFACAPSSFLLACDEETPLDAGAVDAGARADAGPVPCDPPAEPEARCPGDPSCPEGGDPTLLAGAARVAFTPSPDDAEPLTRDVDADGEYDPADGDTFEDLDGDGRYDAVWIAGFGNGRAATGVSDDQWARALALRRGETTVVFLALDVVGWFYDDSAPIREAIADLGVDHLSVSATHTHEARDTIGIWGRSLDEPGRDPAFMAEVQARAAQAVREAVQALRPAHVQYASLRLRDQPGGMLRYVSDTRDPQVIDDEVRILRLFEAGVGAEDGPTIATLINVSTHPEYMGSRNTLLSSDYPHWLREGVEQGVEGPDGPLEGVGGVAVVVEGALGSQIGPGDVQPATWTGEPVERRSREAAQTVGEQLAAFVLRALGPDGGSVTEQSAALAFHRRRFYVPVDNRRYHIAFLQELLVRDLYCYLEDRPIREGVNVPSVLTEVAVIDVGRATMIAVPGELDPALLVGGYDGAYAPAGLEVVDASRDNPPDLARAPAGPYLADRAREDAEQVWLLGLTGDFLGYFIPEFDYELAETLPYINEAPGDHYEETNSLGPQGWPLVRDQLEAMLPR